jgi:hypothetical protein
MICFLGGQALKIDDLYRHAENELEAMMLTKVRCLWQMTLNLHMTL